MSAYVYSPTGVAAVLPMLLEFPDDDAGDVADFCSELTGREQATVFVFHFHGGTGDQTALRLLVNFRQVTYLMVTEFDPYSDSGAEEARRPGGELRFTARLADQESR